MFFCKNNCEHRIAALKARIEDLEEKLELETAWAEGEIDFWQDQCFTAEAEVEELRDILRKKEKPWWRYVIS